jgi:hypothetical protein
LIQVAKWGKWRVFFFFLYLKWKGEKNGETKATRPFPECTRLLLSCLSLCVSELSHLCFIRNRKKDWKDWEWRGKLEESTHTRYLSLIFYLFSVFFFFFLQNAWVIRAWIRLQLLVGSCQKENKRGKKKRGKLLAHYFKTLETVGSKKKFKRVSQPDDVRTRTQKRYEKERKMV